MSRKIELVKPATCKWHVWNNVSIETKKAIQCAGMGERYRRKIELLDDAKCDKPINKINSIERFMNIYPNNLKGL